MKLKEILIGFCVTAGVFGLIIAFLTRQEMNKWQDEHDQEVSGAITTLEANQDTIKANQDTIKTFLRELVLSIEE